MTDVEVTALTLDDDSITIAEAGTQLVTATATPSSESAKTKWEVIDEAVATISDDEGASVTVTGVSAGQTLLKAKNGEAEAYAIITVS